jgi:hypothetical protein
MAGHKWYAAGVGPVSFPSSLLALAWRQGIGRSGPSAPRGPHQRAS